MVRATVLSTGPPQVPLKESCQLSGKGGGPGAYAA